MMQFFFVKGIKFLAVIGIILSIPMLSYSQTAGAIGDAGYSSAQGSLTSDTADVMIFEFQPECKMGDLPSIQFASKSVRITEDAKAVLAAVASQLRQNPGCKVKVTGYSSSDKRSQQLSWDRVSVVIRFLVEKQGISEDRFIFIYGTEGDQSTVDLLATTEEGPTTLPAPHPNLKTVVSSATPKKPAHQAQVTKKTSYSKSKKKS